MATQSYKVSFNDKKKRGQLTRPLCITELREKLGDSFPETQEYNLLIQYRDEDGDEITVNTDEDLKEAENVFASIGKKVMLFELKVSKESSMCGSTSARVPPDSIPDLAKQTEIWVSTPTSPIDSDFASIFLQDFQFEDFASSGDTPESTAGITDLSPIPEFDATNDDIDIPDTSETVAAGSIALLHQSPDANANGQSVKKKRSRKSQAERSRDSRNNKKMKRGNWTTDARSWLEQVAALKVNKVVLERLGDMKKTRPRGGFAKLKQCILAFNEALKDQKINTQPYGYTPIACVENFATSAPLESLDNVESSSTASYLAAAKATVRLLAFSAKGFVWACGGFICKSGLILAPRHWFPNANTGSVALVHMLCCTKRENVVHAAKVVSVSEKWDLLVLRLCQDLENKSELITHRVPQPCGALPLSNEAVKSGERIEVVSFAKAEGSKRATFLEFRGSVSNVDNKGCLTLDLTGFCGMSGSLVRNAKGFVVGVLLGRASTTPGVVYATGLVPGSGARAFINACTDAKLQTDPPVSCVFSEHQAQLLEEKSGEINRQLGQLRLICEANVRDATAEEPPASTVKMLTIDTHGKLQVHADAIKVLSKESGHVNTITIMGKVGTGKSTLGDLLCGAKSFKVSSALDSVTKGVDISTPQPGHTPDAPKKCFCDVEGQDDGFGIGWEAKLAAPLVLTSQALIVNVMCNTGRLSVKSIERLGDVLHVVLVHMVHPDKMKENMLGHLHIVLRDCPPTMSMEAARSKLLDQEDVDKCPGGPTQKPNAVERNKLRANIARYFKSVSVWCLPQPCTNPALFNGVLAGASVEFKEKLRDLKNCLDTQMKTPNFFDAEALTGSMLSQVVAEVAERLNSAPEGSDLSAVLNPVTLLESIREKKRLAEEARLAKERERLAKEQERIAKENARIAEEKRLYAIKVISTTEESRTVEYNRTSVPIMRPEVRSKKVWIGGIVPKWGNACKKTVQYTVQVHAGNTVTKFMRLEKRVVETLGSGKVVARDWSTVREWTEVITTA